MVVCLHKKLSDKSPLYSWILFVTFFSNAVFWMVLILPQISSTVNLFIWFFEEVLSTPTTMGTTVTLFHNSYKV